MLFELFTYFPLTGNQNGKKGGQRFSYNKDKKGDAETRNSESPIALIW